MQNTKHEKFMRMAIRLSEQNVTNGIGGPFGAVIVRDGELVAKSANRVTTTLDPTAHAEVSAIRKACRKLKTFDLTGCVIYTSCEPCPMCLSAIYWSHIEKIYFANTKQDAQQIGFDDQFIYDEIALPMNRRKLEIQQILRDEALIVFEQWDNSDLKIAY